MTPLLLLLAAVQAGLLLWAAVHLGNVALRPKKIRALAWGLVTFGLAFGIAKYTGEHDRIRALCSVGDCFILALSVAGVRVIAVNREEDQLALHHEENLRRAAEAAEAARRAQQAELLAAAHAALEARTANEAKKAVDPHQPPRHLTPSLLRGGAPSPRLPTSPRK